MKEKETLMKKSLEKKAVLGEGSFGTEETLKEAGECDRCGGDNVWKRRPGHLGKLRKLFAQAYRDQIGSMDRGGSAKMRNKGRIEKSKANRDRGKGLAEKDEREGSEEKRKGEKDHT